MLFSNILYNNPSFNDSYFNNIFFNNIFFNVFGILFNTFFNVFESNSSIDTPLSFRKLFVISIVLVDSLFKFFVCSMFYQLRYSKDS